MTVNMNGHSHPEPHCLGCIFTRSSEEIETHTKGKLPGYNESVSEVMYLRICILIARYLILYFCILQALKQVNVQYDEKIENIVYNSIDSISDELREISVDVSISLSHY